MLTPNRLLIQPAGQKSSINHERLSGIKRRRLGAQVHCSSDQLFTRAKSPHRRSSQQFLAARGVVKQVRIQTGADDARGDCVHRNALLRPLHRRRTRKRNYSCLAGRVSRNLMQRNETIERRNVDNAPVPPLQHVPPEDLAGAQRPREIRIQNIGPFLFRHVERRHAFYFSRTVNKDVDFAKTTDRRGQKCFERGAITHIRSQAKSLALTPLYLRRDFVNHLPPPRRGDNIRAGIGKPQAQSAPNPGAPSDNDGSLAFEAQDVGRHYFSAPAVSTPAFRSRATISSTASSGVPSTKTAHASDGTSSAASWLSSNAALMNGWYRSATRSLIRAADACR